MTYLRNLVFYHTITPLHVGCGQDVGVVDLPVIRERTTGYPFIPGSGIRGSLRSLFGEGEDRDELFGPDADKMDEEESRYAGCVAVHDAQILFFPVRSDQAPYVWITCPAVLHRFSRDSEILLDGEAGWKVPAPVFEDGNDGIVFGPFPPGTLHLEEVAFSENALDEILTTWLGKAAGALGAAEIVNHTVVVSDETFHYFVSHATQVMQHNRLTASKTVEDGLFSVESVPPETFFYGFIGATDSRRPKKKEEAEQGAAPRESLKRMEALATVQGVLEKGFLHLGGDEGTGLGVTRIVWIGSVTKG